MKSSSPLNQTFEKIEEAKLGEMLVRKGLITQAELAQVLGEQQIMLGQLLIQSGLISEVELYKALELQHGSNKKRFYRSLYAKKNEPAELKQQNLMGCFT